MNENGAQNNFNNNNWGQNNPPTGPNYTWKPAPNGQTFVPVMKVKKKTMFPKTLIIILAIAIFGVSFFAGYKLFFRPVKNRTIMMYVVGSDLETSGGYASFDLNDISSTKVDLENNNVLLMVGGSKKWHNFVDPDEIAIYSLTKDGFNKVKSYEVTNMGSGETLTKFLNYSYSKYPAKKYDLIFWNHGLGSLGLEEDEITEDFITLNELKSAFNNSSFSYEKIETTILVNCMGANLQLVNVFKDFSNYLVASEEIVTVSALLDKLNFIQTIETKDTGIDFGQKYIKQAKSSIEKLNKTYNYHLDFTYSLLDLSKLSQVSKALDEFVEIIDIKKNYYGITAARNSIHTYGGEVTNDYDLVDLKTFANKIKKYSTLDKYNNLVKALNDCVIYNESLNNYSNGLSVYFPSKGSSIAINTHFKELKKQEKTKYLKFITDYKEIKDSYIRRDLEEGITLTNKINIGNDVVSIKLTDEEIKEYNGANILIFKKNNDNYQLLLKSDNVELNDEGYLIYQNNSEIFKMNSDKKTFDISAYEVDDNYYTNITIEQEDMKINAIARIELNDINPRITSISLKSDRAVGGGIINTEDHNSFSFVLNFYDLSDIRKLEDTKEEIEESINLNDAYSISTQKDDYIYVFEFNDLGYNTHYSKIN